MNIQERVQELAEEVVGLRRRMDAWDNQGPLGSMATNILRKVEGIEKAIPTLATKADIAELKALLKGAKE